MERQQKLVCADREICPSISGALLRALASVATIFMFFLTSALDLVRRGCAVRLTCRTQTGQPAAMSE